MKPLIKKSGFREYDCRWLIDKSLNEAGMEVLGKAWGTQLQQDYGIEKMFVAHDYREYSKRYQEAFIKGLLSTGIEVVNIGLQITSSAYFAVYHLKINGGAIITASHNKNGWTGLKLVYGPSKTVGPKKIKRLKLIVESQGFLKGKGKLSEDRSIKDAYIEDLVKDFDFQKQNKKIKIVVSTGNGTAGVFTPNILKKAGLEIIEHNTKLDWTFPNGNPDPEDIGFLEGSKKTVLENQADLAVLIDGDGDRLGILDEKGEIIFNDKTGLMISRELVKDKEGSKFVIDIKSTGAWELDDIINKTNSKVVFCKTGHYYVKEKMAKTGALAGFERAGHCFFGDGLGRGYDEANQAALYLIKYLILKNKALSEWENELPQSYQSPTMQAECPEEKKYEITKSVDKRFKEYLDSGNEIAGKKIDHIINPGKNPKYGSRIIFNNGSWGLIRASANEPLMEVIAESFESYEHLYKLVLELKSELTKFPEVSTSYDQEMQKP